MGNKLEDKIKQLEEELAEEKSQSRERFNQFPGASYIIDLKSGKFVDVNTSALKQTGYSRETLLNLTPKDLLNPTDYQKFKERVKKAIQGQPIDEKLNYQILKKDNTTSWVSLETNVIYKNGEPSEIIATAYDTTELIQIHEKLKERNESIENILHNLPIGVAVNKISTGEAIITTPLFLDTYRVSEKDFSSLLTFLDAVYLNQPKLKQQILEDIISGNEKKMQWKKVPIIKNGKTTYISAQNIPLPNEDLMISTVWDVTKEIKYEKDLKKYQIEREILLGKLKISQTALNSTSEIIYVLDKYLNFTQSNPATEKRMGSNNLIGHNYRNIHPQSSEENLNELQEKINKVIETGETIKIEHQSNKDKKYFLKTIDRIEVNGEYQAMVIAHDITQQKTLEHKLKESNATKDKLISIIAHDLKSPFNGMLGFLNLLKLEYSKFTDEERKEYISNANISANNAFNLLNNLLEWSRTQTNKITTNPNMIDVGDLVDNMMYLQNSDLKKIKINNNLKDITVYADPNQINTIFRNLISNAIKYSREGETITIGTDGVKEGYQSFYVQDTGIGMSKEVKKTIFQIGHESRKGTNNETGTGLGLLLCDEFVKAHGGEIYAESEVNKGTKISFTLPTTKNDYLNKLNLTNDNPNKETNTSNDKKKILIVEDDYTSIELYKAMLGKDYELVIADDGKTAVDIALDGQGIDLILMDIKLPYMNGYNAMLKIRESNQQIPIIANTGICKHGDKEKYIEQGFTDYTLKPDENNKLIEIIKKYI